MSEKIIQPYKYPVHRYCGERECTSRKRLGRHRFKIEFDRRPNRLGGSRVLIVGLVWGDWFRCVQIGR